MSSPACDYYHPDPPANDYEAEYSRPADMSWLKKCPPLGLQQKSAEVKIRTSPISLVPHGCPINRIPADRPRSTDRPSRPAPPQLTIITGGKSGEGQPCEVRRDGASAVVECAAKLEWICNLFKLEADERAILDVEPHLRRVSRAANQLTREAARVRRKQSGSTPENSLFFDMDFCPEEARPLRLPVFSMDDTEGIRAHIERSRKSKKEKIKGEK